MKSRLSLFIFIVVLLLSSLVYAINIKDVIFQNPSYGKVVFDHNEHLKQPNIKNNCRTCHNALFDLKKKVTYTMAEMEKNKSCGACHNGKQAFSVQDCSKCHAIKQAVFKVPDLGNVTFSHQAHLAMFSCSDCHDKLYLPSSNNKKRSMAEMEAGKSCGACHDGKAGFTVKENCEKCHKM